MYVTKYVYVSSIYECMYVCMSMHVICVGVSISLYIHMVCVYS